MIRNDRHITASNSQGFTLIELLVAIAIFALMSAVAFGGLQTILNGNEATRIESEKLKKLQTALWLLERDLHHVVDRGIRDEFGDEQTSLKGESGIQPQLTFTYTGRRNPLGQKRSNLERVIYTEEDGSLVRTTAAVLDRIQDTSLFRATLLQNIEQTQFRFLDQQAEWHDTWPPLQTGDGVVSSLPVAIEIQFKDKKWGSIRRLIVLPRRR